MEIASKALAGVNTLRGIINSERLFYADHSTYNPTTTATITHMSQIAQGDGNGARTGNSVLAKSIQFNMSVSKHPTATLTFTRVMFFIDKRQVADTAPVIGDLLVSASTVALKNTQAVLANRFEVIYDKTFHLSSTGQATDIDKGFFELHHHIIYNGSAVSDIDKGGIYMLTLSNEATNTPTQIISYRLSYYDN